MTTCCVLLGSFYEARLSFHFYTLYLPFPDWVFPQLPRSMLTNTTVHQSAEWHKENIKDILNPRGYKALSERHRLILLELVSYNQY